MIPYLPRIYEDELVYSWFARYFAHSGYPCYINALEDILVKRNSAADIEFIGPVNKEAKNAIESIISMHELILDHTMFPQYARFLSLDCQKKALNSLQNGGTDIYNLLYIPISKPRPVVQYCPLCAKEDRETYGECYFHRSHIIRGITVCAKHKCKLLKTELEISKSKSPRLYVPEDIIPLSRQKDIMLQDGLEKEFSEYLMECFSFRFEFSDSKAVREYMNSKLDGTPYLSKTGNKKYVSLLYDDLINFFKGLVPHGIREPYHLQKVLTGYNTNFLWICQIAFFLNIPAQELCDSCSRLKAINSSKWNKPSPKSRNYSNRKGSSKKDWAEMDKSLAPVVKKVVQDIYSGKRGRPGKVTIGTVTRMMGWPDKRIDCLPMCKEIILNYYESYADYWARECVWAYQVLESEMGEKDIFWKHLKDKINLTRKHFELCIPNLEKYTSCEIAQKIKSLI